MGEMGGSAAEAACACGRIQAQLYSYSQFFLMRPACVTCPEFVMKPSWMPEGLITRKDGGERMASRRERELRLEK